MFRKTNNRQAKTMKNDTPGQPNINMISAGTVISGTLQTNSDLRISGTVDGHITAESKCIVAESGLVKGDLSTKEADIAGTVEGELLVSNRLILRSSAVIIGDITTKVIMVEEGARIDGACKMSDQIDITKGGKNSNGSASRNSGADKSTVSVSESN
jgi:cytoskeletal protein CcmA (bactofilin family)